MKYAQIGQGAGDILATIPYMKELGVGFVYMVNKLPHVPDWHPINFGGAEMLLPFLRSQGLDGQVIDFKDISMYTHDINMDRRFLNNWMGSLGDFYTWNSLFYGVYPDMTKPFFKLDPVPKNDYIVFARTARYNNKVIDYRFLNSISGKKMMIGTQGEVEYLNKCFPGIKDFELYPIKDYLEAAQLIMGSRLFISNQTSFAVLAEGLGVPRVLEVCPNFPSVIPKTPHGRPVITQRFFEKAIIDLLALSDGR